MNFIDGLFCLLKIALIPMSFIVPLGVIAWLNIRRTGDGSVLDREGDIFP